MSSQDHVTSRPEAAIEVFLLGRTDYEACLALQHRLVYETSGRTDGQIQLLITEHPPLITVGRAGAREHIRPSRRSLAARGLRVRYVNRGGGCLVHGPGQLAVYPIVPLAWHHLAVGPLLDRVLAAIRVTLVEASVATVERRRQGLWGRRGQLVFMGAAVKRSTSYHGAYINVDPQLDAFDNVVTDPWQQSRVSSLALERERPVRMSQVRQGLIRHFADAFACPRYHIYTGHPFATPTRRSLDEYVRVS